MPVYLLDTDLPENQPWDRTLTDRLYGGDDYYLLCHEVVLGFSGYRLLRALGYASIRRFHTGAWMPAVLQRCMTSWSKKMMAQYLHNAYRLVGRHLRGG